MENYTTSEPVNRDNGKTVAIICYLTLLGWIIGLVMHSNNKTSLGAYHLRQTLGLMILGFAASVLWFPLLIIPFLGWLLLLALYIGLFAFWIMGIITAANGEEKPLPIVGDMFQKWFAGFGV